MRHEVSSRCLDRLQAREQLRLKAYKCPRGLWTIGWGHLMDQKTTKGWETISEIQARVLFIQDVAKAAASVEDLVQVDLNQSQFDSLVSFVFNVGHTAFAESTMLHFLNDGHYDEAADEFDRWIYVTHELPNGAKVKTVLDGLVKRRAEEKDEFLSAA